MTQWVFKLKPPAVWAAFSLGQAGTRWEVFELESRFCVNCDGERGL